MSASVQWLLQNIIKIYLSVWKAEFHRKKENRKIFHSLARFRLGWSQELSQDLPYGYRDSRTWAIFPNIFKGIWIGSGADRTQATAHIGCWYCRWPQQNSKWKNKVSIITGPWLTRYPNQMDSSPFPFCFDVVSKAEWQRAEWDTERSFTLWFTSNLAVMVEAGPGQSQKAELHPGLPRGRPSIWGFLHCLPRHVSNELTWKGATWS